MQSEKTTKKPFFLARKEYSSMHRSDQFQFKTTRANYLLLFITKTYMSKNQNVFI